MFRCIFGCILCSVVVIACTERIPQEIKKYLKPGDHVNSDNSLIVSKAGELTGNISDKVQRARVLFEFVRDEIDEKYCAEQREYRPESLSMKFT